MADPDGACATHLQRLLRIEGDRVEIESWLRADAQPWAHQRQTLARDGRVIETEALEAASPPAFAPRQEIAWPIALGHHEIRRRLHNEVWELRLHRIPRPGEARPGPGVKLGSVAADPSVVFFSFTPGEGPRPPVAVLAWRVESPRARIEGLEILDLRRARAALVLARGLRLHRAGDTSSARELFRHALDLDPDFPEALYDLACAQALEDQTDEALSLLRRAFKHSPHRLRVIAEDDPDLDGLRALPAFEALFER